MTPKCPRCHKNLKEISAKRKALVCKCGFYYSRLFRKKESMNMFLVCFQLSLFGAFFGLALSLALFPDFRNTTFAFAKQFIEKDFSPKSQSLRYTKTTPIKNYTNKTPTKAQKHALKKRSIAKQAATPQHKNRN